ncbi:hypothetical protein [Nostoc sp. C052]|nr:hypothetical protein [Nostoc sp. C052]
MKFTRAQIPGEHARNLPLVGAVSSKVFGAGIQAVAETGAVA